jgi:phosphoglycerate dehydrogenase-like enzyme
MKKYKIAVLDDYQNVALESADWSVLRDRADIAVFQDHLAELDAVIERLPLLKKKRIAGAAIDVFDIELLSPPHPFRTLDNVLATPHIGYVSHGLYKTFYEDTVSNIRKWLDTH